MESKVRKFSSDLSTLILAFSGGIFTSCIFVQVERISWYYGYLSRSHEYHCYMSAADPFWWLPFSIWHTFLFVVAGFIGHRYWSGPERSPFVFGQILGGIVLLGWIFTLGLITGLDYLADPRGYILERALAQVLSWSGFRYLTSIFAGNVIYASLMQGAARHFAIEAHLQAEP